MMGRRKVLAPHAPLYPIAGDVKIVIAARGAEGRPVREQMLSPVLCGEKGKGDG